MKDYLKEDIAFDKLIFSTLCTVLTLMVAGILGTIFNKDITAEQKYFILGIGIVFTTLIISAVVFLYFDIKESINKLKNYD